MNYSAEIKIKDKNADKIKKVLEIDKDYRDDTSTKYEFIEGQLVVTTNCHNLVSLKKSIQENLKKITLIEEVVAFVEENKE